MRRTLVMAPLALLGASLVLSSSAVALAEPTVNECFAISQAERDTGVELAMANGCDRGISCHMTWKLQCESPSGKVTAESRGRAGVLLASGEHRKTFASASACQSHAGWTLSDVQFACTPVR
ncbi:MAG: hypothetical protein IPF92_28970 [Myxococcales bacterium]|nr:hypothetical protein [Myxococcales bacterium]HQY64711.1 hypothetical protein [Polyangiaceae bacterium]